MKKLSFAVAGAVLALSFYPVQAQDSQAAVLSACTSGDACAAAARAFLAGIPNIQARQAAANSLATALSNAVTAGTVSRAAASSGVGAAASYASAADQVTLNQIASTLSAPGGNTPATAATPGAGLTGPGAGGSGV